MKLTRLTDDRYILSVGQNVTREQAEELRLYFDAWLKAGGDPKILIFNGQPVEYEDRREPDLEKRLAKIEKDLRMLKIKAKETTSHGTGGSR